MSEELKPCPFCNSAALVRERHTDDGKPFFVECQGWEFDCGITVAYAATAEQSASLWNRRASGDGGKSEAVPVEAWQDTKRAALYRAREFISEICDEYCIPRPFGLFEDLDAALAQEAQAVPKRCEYCDGTGDVHGFDGEWRGECTACDAAKAAPQSVPAQPVAWMKPNETFIRDAFLWTRDERCHPEYNVPVYTAPPAAEQDADTAGAKLVSDQVHLRSLYDMVYAHECTFKAFAADISEIAAGASNERADAAPLDKSAEQDVPRALTDEQRQAVRDALSMALGDSYDCTRVWSAWGVGTMGPDDFVLITDDADRVAEIADAAIDAILTAAGAK